MCGKSRNERNPYLPWRSGPRNSKETASDKLEEGGDDVKSSWPLRPGYVLQWRIKKRPRESKRTLQCVVVRIESATLTPEVGIANRGSECHGEYVPGPRHTARPSRAGSGLQKK